MNVPHPPSAYGDRVQLYRLTPGINSGGGKIATFIKTGDPLPCRVVRLAAKAKDLEVVTNTETTFEISFPARPAGEPRDLYAWLDTTIPDLSSELDRIEIIERAMPRDPAGRMWMAFGVIVQ